MSKKLFTLHFSLFFFLFLFCAYGQVDDPRSKKIIDDMTARFKTYPSVFLNFSATGTLLQGQQETELTGKLWIKKTDKYKLEIPDQVFYFDGSKIYQYLTEVKEVNVKKLDPNENNEDIQLFNPLTYFNLSSKSFQSKLVKESTLNNRRVYEIDLYPIQVKTTKFSRIRFMIEKSTYQLVYINAIMKDTTQFAITFKPYDIQKTALPDSFFTFNKLEHPDVEIIDLSF